ncbi:MAG: AMP-binding protein [Pseudomonadota bacterium]
MATGTSVAPKGASDGLDTFPKLLLRNAVGMASRPAMREKDLGIWQTWTWSQVLEEIEPYARGLKDLGLKSGDKVAIVGDNRPRLYWTFVAAQSIRAIPVPVYQDSVAEEMVYVLDHAEVAFAVVENQEQVDKVLSIQDQLPNLTTIVYDDPRGLRDYDHSHLFSFEMVQDKGRNASYSAEDWRKEIAAGTGDDAAVMLYTSGTTGKPKGVVLTNDNVRISADNAVAFDNLTENDTILSYLPMAWVGDHVFSFAESYVAGICIACPENSETMHQDMIEVGPSFFFAPPRVFETMLTNVTIRMEDAGKLKQKMFNYFLGVAKRVGEDVLDGKSVSFGDKLLYRLGEFFVYGPLKNTLGLSNVRVGYTAGEAIGPEMFSFYRSLGINLKQLYGQTEATVFVTAQPDGGVRADAVGVPAPGVDIKIADNGEVLFKSPGVFKEYFKNPDATKSTKTDDGWVLTGDAGFFEKDGQLKIIDCAKDVGKLTDGSLFAPKYIENKLKFFPNIKEAVAIGHGRDFATAMINIDLQAVGNWAERNNISYASYQELAGHPTVYEMISEHVNDVNKQLADEPNVAGAQIKRFLILHKELDADDGELTRTQKVRRSFIFDRYEPLMDALYDGSDEKHVTTIVTFEDGRQGEISATVKIGEAETYPFEATMKEAAE